jgi:hypothetical protein
MTKTIDRELTSIMNGVASAIQAAPRPDADTLSFFGRLMRSPSEAIASLWPGSQVRADSITDDDNNLLGFVTTVADDEGVPIVDRDAFALASARVIQREYPQKKFGMGLIVPIDSTLDGVSVLDNGQQVYMLAQYDLVGSMALVTDYAAGGPAVDVRFEKAAVTAKTIGAKFILSFAELGELVKSAGRSLADFKYAALRQAYINYIDYGCVFGDPRAGLDGLLTISGKTEYIAPTPVVAGMSADLLLSMLGDMASAVTIATNTVETSDIFVTPFRVMNVAVNLRRTNSSRTVYEEFMESQRMARLVSRWETSESLRRADAGQDVAFMLPFDREKLCIKCPTPLSFLDGLRQGLGYVVHAMATTLLLVTPSPACILIIRGL